MASVFITWPLSQSVPSLAMNTTGVATLSGERSGLSALAGAGLRMRSCGIEAVMRVAAPGEIAFDVTP